MPTTYKLIETKSLASATNIVTFSGIPQTYGTLVLDIMAQDNSGGANRTDIWLYPNSDTYTTVYTNRILFYDGNNRLRGYDTNQSATSAIPTAGNGANYYSGIKVTIPNYASTNVRKTWLGLGSFAASTSQAFNQLTIWNTTTNNDPITSFSIRCTTSAQFSVNSKFTLYGLANS